MNVWQCDNQSQKLTWWTLDVEYTTLIVRTMTKGHVRKWLCPVDRSHQTCAIDNFVNRERCMIKTFALLYILHKHFPRSMWHIGKNKETCWNLLAVFFVSTKESSVTHSQQNFDKWVLAKKFPFGSSSYVQHSSPTNPVCFRLLSSALKTPLVARAVSARFGGSLRSSQNFNVEMSTWNSELASPAPLRPGFGLAHWKRSHPPLNRMFPVWDPPSRLLWSCPNLWWRFVLPRRLLCCLLHESGTLFEKRDTRSLHFGAEMKTILPDAFLLQRRHRCHEPKQDFLSENNVDTVSGRSSRKITHRHVRMLLVRRVKYHEWNATFRWPTLQLTLRRGASVLLLSSASVAHVFILWFTRHCAAGSITVVERPPQRTVLAVKRKENKNLEELGLV